MRHVHERGAPLGTELLRELEELAAMPDSEIDFTDRPETNTEDWRRGVRGGYSQRTSVEITLPLTLDTAAWLSANARHAAHAINYVLKQIVQHGRRARLERQEGSDRPIYDRTSAAFLQGLELLSGRRAARPEYVELPEFSDAELRAAGIGPCVPLTAKEVTLFVDAEVAEWLRESGQSYSLRINYALAYLASQMTGRTEQKFSKAS